jgi:hypothetical protein
MVRVRRISEAFLPRFSADREFKTTLYRAVCTANLPRVKRRAPGDQTDLKKTHNIRPCRLDGPVCPNNLRFDNASGRCALRAER